MSRLLVSRLNNAEEPSSRMLCKELRACRYVVSHRSSRHVCTLVGMLQSSYGRICTALAGSKWSLVGEHLLSLRAEGYGGVSLRPFLYVKRVQKFSAGF